MNSSRGGRRLRHGVLAAGAGGSALALAACGLLPSATDVRQAGGSEPSQSPAATPTDEPDDGSIGVDPPPGEGLDRYLNQDVTWDGCGGDIECTTVLVPLDYDAPDDLAIELSVARRPASGGDPIASMLVNPGGPGGSGVGYARAAEFVFGAPLLENFDVVGWDPRGVNESTAVDCVDDDELDEYVAIDPTPDDAAEVDQVVAAVTEFVAGCDELTGELLPHISTVDAARDIDVLRSVVGDEQLTYFGASYGTFLGATYADLFPERVGRLVLDGAVDPALGGSELSIAQAGGFEVALDAFLADCAARPDCPVGASIEEGRATLTALLEQIDAAPISGDGDREVTEGIATLGIILPLYLEDYWEGLRAALGDALEGDGEGLLEFADLYGSRGPDGEYQDNSLEAISAVNCLDRPGAQTVEEVQAEIPLYTQASPFFGEVLAWGSLSCALWPVEPTGQPAPLDAAGAPPILVVGTTRDPATPYEWSVAMASQLQSGVLLSRDGDGHTAYGMDNDCIDDAIEAYLVDGTVPADGTMC